MPDTQSALLALLALHPGLSQQELADRAGVSTRTARRHLTALVEEGTVLFDTDGPTHHYRLADHAYPLDTPPPTFTEGEMEALAVAVLAARPLLAPTPLAHRLTALADKLRHRWLGEVLLFDSETDAAHWSFDGAAGGERPPASPAVFRTLLDAMRGQHPVRATYHTASRDETRAGRRLAPLGFLVRDGAWLVPAADLDLPDHPVKDFALTGFREATCLADEQAFRPDGFDLPAYAEGHFGALEGEPETVRLLVEPEAVPYFKRKRYARSQQIEEQADGRAVVSFEAGGMDAVKAWCLSWGPKVRVLAPAALAEQVAEAHREAARRYESE